MTRRIGAVRTSRSFEKAKAEVEALARGESLPSFHHKKRQHLEDDEQRGLFFWVNRMALTDQRYKAIFATPNGGTRNPKEAARMKGQGVKAGVSDIFVAVPAWISGLVEKHGLWIEMKRPLVPKGRKPETSPEQIEWMERMQRNGYIACLCYGKDQAQEAITAYLAGREVPHQWEPK